MSIVKNKYNKLMYMQKQIIKRKTSLKFKKKKNHN